MILKQQVVYLMLAKRYHLAALGNERRVGQSA